MDDPKWKNIKVEKKHGFFGKKYAFRKNNNMFSQTTTTTTTTTNDSKPVLSFKIMFFAKQKTAVQQVFPRLILKKKKIYCLWKKSVYIVLCFFI